MGKILLNSLLFIVIGFSLFALTTSTKHGFFNASTAEAQAYPTINPNSYDQNGNIPPAISPGYNAVWTPGVGWQYIPPVGGSTGTGETTNVAGFSPGTDHLPDGWTWTQNSTPCGSEQYCYIDATGHYQHGVPPTNGGTGGTDGSGGANDPCSTTTNKPNGCSCTTAQAASCTSGYCGITNGQSSGTCQTNPSTNGGITGGTLTCDPVANGQLDQDDFNVWKQEYLHNVNTTRSACLSPNNQVDLLGFQHWKNVAILNLNPTITQAPTVSPAQGWNWCTYFPSACGL